ncbi:MAG: M1 family metallopeptidase [Cytophagales bacterium]|nr:M1 family metallopeptidase [Cytophagales bacterium]
MKINRLVLLIPVLGSLIACQSTSQIAKSNKAPIKDTVTVPEWVANKGPYNPSRTIKNDLLHTKLEVKFDWQKQYLYGTAELTFKPYFYSQKTLELDAKGMDIQSVSLKKGSEYKDLAFKYDRKVITITLDTTYNRLQTYSVKINYVAKPNELPVGGSDAITSDKGLYFINPDGKELGKPKQIWTQGETESSSCWFPTIDSPNEKTTQEIYITVEDNYKTLPNGSLIYSMKNADGTRTDYWKMEKPHSPYLFMMAVGEFAVVKDSMVASNYPSLNNLEINYYVEPSYKKYAKTIFGKTPEMIKFFSEKLGYPYPWEKYSQVVVRDYVSGAMENTSATIMMEALQIDNREALDTDWDYIIAHELFHHWFGDLVTCESWSNLPLNESFANYSEYLWEEYKNGVDAADFHAQEELNGYLNESLSKQEPIIRYRYMDREDMFDAHSYNKGGRILHMLRKQVGDAAFFASLNLYLKKNEFKPAEVHHLRQAFEEITGEDLNWFFNQWFLSPGHASIKVSHSYSDSTLKIKVWQMQDSLYTPIYRLPVKLDVWTNGKRKRTDLVVTKKYEEFSLPLSQKPDAIYFDGETQVVGVIDHKKSDAELINQYFNSEKYLARYEALAQIEKSMNDAAVRKMAIAALNDPFWKIREMAVNKFSEYSGIDSSLVFDKIKSLALSDRKTKVRSAALELLAKTNAKGYKSVFEIGMKDSSYLVTAASLSSYILTKSPDVSDKVGGLSNILNAEISNEVADYYMDTEDSTKLAWFEYRFAKFSGADLYRFVQKYGKYAGKLSANKQKSALQVLENMAKNHVVWYVRLGAFRALNDLKMIDGIKEIRKSIKAQETYPRLKEYYSQMPD